MKKYVKFYDKIVLLYIKFSDDFIDSDKCSKLIIDIQKEILKVEYNSKVDF